VKETKVCGMPSLFEMGCMRDGLSHPINGGERRKTVKKNV
jgi:hypothetical protein